MITSKNHFFLTRVLCLKKPRDRITLFTLYIVFQIIFAIIIMLTNIRDGAHRFYLGWRTCSEGLGSF